MFNYLCLGTLLLRAMDADGGRFPMADEKKKKKLPHVDIDIPGTTSKTKVSELTIGQLVNVLVQVHTQLPIQRGMPDPKIISEAMAEIHRQIASPDAAFRQVQAAVLKQIPNILKQGNYAPKDGGPSPHAKGRAPGSPS
jgi:hypothetical protein